MRRRGPFRGFVRSAAFCGLVVSLVAGLSRQASWRHNSYGVVYHSNSRRHVGGRVHNNTLYRPGYDDTVFEQFDYDDPCRNFPDTKGIQLVMKTGATEIYDKLPAHLLTALQCLPDVLLFSDRVSSVACGEPLPGGVGRTGRVMLFWPPNCGLLEVVSMHMSGLSLTRLSGGANRPVVCS